MSLVIQKSGKKFAPRASKRKFDEISHATSGPNTQDEVPNSQAAGTPPAQRPLPVSETPPPSSQLTTAQPSGQTSAPSQTKILVPRNAPSSAITALAHVGLRSQQALGRVSVQADLSPGALSSTAVSRKAGPKFRKRGATVEEQIVDEDDDQPGSQRKSGTRGAKLRKRGESPEDSELIEIVTATCTMGDLIRDAPRGKKSGRYEDIKGIDLKALRKQNREQEEEITSQRDSHRRGVESRLDRLAAAATSSQSGMGGPKMKIVNGQLVVDQDSLRLDRHAAAQDIEEILEEVEESDLTSIVNSATFGKHIAKNRWTPSQTDQFYFGLRSFGTDFEIISRMIPGMTRRHVKLKFEREEKLNLVKVNAALLGERTPISLDEFAVKAGIKVEELPDPGVIHAELQEVAARLKKQVEDEKATELATLERRRIAAEASHAAAETADAVDDASGQANAGSSGSRPRQGASADGVQNSSRQRTPGGNKKKKSRKGKGKKEQADKVEELGTIDEMPPAPVVRQRRR